MSRAQQRPRAIVRTIQIPNGGIHDVTQPAPGEPFEGTLYGEDPDGTRWAMPFWLPERAVQEWAA